MLKFDLNYKNNSTALFERIRHLDWAIWLDSGKPLGEYGRYDIMVATGRRMIASQKRFSY